MLQISKSVRESRSQERLFSVGVRAEADSLLFLSMVVLLGLGILMVYSATAISSVDAHGSSLGIINRHLFHITLGLFGFWFCSKLHLGTLERWARPLFLLGLLLLVAVLIPGISREAGGARRWLSFGVMSIQPGEFVKLLTVVYFAAYISRHREKLARFVSGVLVPLVLLGVLGLLYLLQPDFGSSVVVAVVVLSQLLVGGVSLGHLFLFGAIASGGFVALAMSSPYRLRRITAFLDPFKDPENSGYQLIQSLIAVGSGGLTGLGLGAGKQKLFYLPAGHNDFIFAVIAEELGFLGALFVLIVYLMIAWRGLRIAARLSGDAWRSSLALGLTLLIVMPAFLAVGVVTGVLPTKGLVMPLVSFGGSAMLMNLCAFGLLLNLSRKESL